ncbi:uncharacterized protein YALI1_A05583g [Yarrowia lipolytica]|uniref:Uncharacterized protein n=1 Tax=Yarrowia lipolytica TaxID=4952 RepID=A0A1D8N3T0_YARLL|nr:hypothetical protein YALI1_A05583g [Yarrowia lipolytica]
MDCGVLITVSKQLWCNTVPLQVARSHRLQVHIGLGYNCSIWYRKVHPYKKNKDGYETFVFAAVLSSRDICCRSSRDISEHFGRCAQQSVFGCRCRRECITGCGHNFSRIGGIARQCDAL